MAIARKIPTNIVTVAPTIEPVTLDDVRLNAYIVDDDTDNMFITDQLIPAAREYVESLANRSLITQTRKQIYDGMPDSPVLFRFSPVQSVSSFTYLDTSLATQTVASSRYRVDTNSVPGRMEIEYNQTWPSAVSVANSVNITYVAGYGSTVASVPITYRRAIILLATQWYNNRDAMACGDAIDHGRLLEILSIEGASQEYV